jgi:glyoxylase-like metal-dependent hydrolase (beta-lactamase superfamily II)
MIEEISANLYKIEIPLPENPLKTLNSYVIKASGGNLIIDTGMNREECMTAMQAGLKTLEIDLRKTDFFITHMHVDHLGLVSNLATDTSIIYFNQPDFDWIKSGSQWDDLINFARLNNFPEDMLQVVLCNHPFYKYGPKGQLDFDILKDDCTISIGDYLFKCVETPGHTRGHMCLYEPNKKLLVSGDHILSNITSNIQLWSNKWNPLNEYLASLDKVYELDIKLVMPGHRDMFSNCKVRIQELKHHHKERVNEVLSVLGKASMSAFQVASRLNWNVAYDSWDLFPILQKWFATGETIAHLKYLTEKGMVRREMEGPKILFSLNVNSAI